MTPIRSLSKIAAAAAITAGLALAGCAVHAHPPARHAHARHGKVVFIEKGHVHGTRCGHYRHHGRWYHVRGHVHGPRCGHALVGGVWVRRH